MATYQNGAQNLLSYLGSKFKKWTESWRSNLNSVICLYIFNSIPNQMIQFVTQLDPQTLEVTNNPPKKVKPSQKGHFELITRNGCFHIFSNSSNVSNNLAFRLRFVDGTRRQQHLEETAVCRIELLPIGVVAELENWTEQWKRAPGCLGCIYIYIGIVLPSYVKIIS